MLLLEEKEITRIQRNIGIACTAVSITVTLINFSVLLVTEEKTLGKILLNPRVSTLLFNSVLCFLSAVILRPGFRIVQVAIFVATASFAAAVGGPSNLAAASVLVCAFLLALQYGLIQSGQWLPALVGLGMYVFGLAMGVASGTLTVPDAVLIALATGLFLYLVWVAFGEQFRDYVRRNKQLTVQAETTLAENEELERLVRERTRELERSVEEKTTLIREVHHRVRNDLGLIDSMLTLQSDTSRNPEVRQVLTELQNRIHSMALIHEELYRSESLSGSNLGSYLSSLSANLTESYGVGTPYELEIDVDAVRLPMDKAIPCGIVLTECITNSIKYGFPDDRPRLIKIVGRLTAGTLSLTIADNGVGIPRTVNVETPDSFGLWLIRTLVVEQLHGTLSLDTAGGTAWTARIPV